MRLILSYPSRASALHTYHYLAMIYRVWSSLVTRQFLHVITASGIITTAHSSHTVIVRLADTQPISVFGQQLALSCQL